MPVYRFERVEYQRTKAGRCPVCDGRVRRSRTFGQTLNPFNRNAAGGLKTRAEIWHELSSEADEWAPDFTHARCREAS